MKLIRNLNLYPFFLTLTLTSFPMMAQELSSSLMPGSSTRCSLKERMYLDSDALFKMMTNDSEVDARKEHLLCAQADGLVYGLYRVELFTPTVRGEISHFLAVFDRNELIAEPRSELAAQPLDQPLPQVPQPKVFIRGLGSMMFPLSYAKRGWQLLLLDITGDGKKEVIINPYVGPSSTSMVQVFKIRLSKEMTEVERLAPPQTKDHLNKEPDMREPRGFLTDTHRNPEIFQKNGLWHIKTHIRIYPDDPDTDLSNYEYTYQERIYVYQPEKQGFIELDQNPSTND